MDKPQAKQVSDVQHMNNIFEHFQRQVSSLQTTVANYVNTQLENEGIRNVPYVNQLISYKLIYNHNWLLSKRVGVRENEFSSVLRRHPL